MIDHLSPIRLRPLRAFVFAAAAVAVSTSGLACSGSDGESGNGTAETTVTEVPTSDQLSDLGVNRVDAAPDGVEMGVDADRTITVDAAVDPPDDIQTWVVRDNPTSSTVEAGDKVIVAYSIVEWESGELVGQTSEDADPFEVYLPADGSVGMPLVAPQIAAALVGAPVGGRIGVLLPRGTTGLPDHLDADHAYVVSADIADAVPVAP